MTKDDIKKAAEEYANDVCRGSLHRSGLEQYCMVDFMEGAKWRTKIVWHDAIEVPETLKLILVENKGGSISLCRILAQKSNTESWLRWAYMEDLLPNTGE